MEKIEDQPALLMKYFLDNFPLDLFAGKQTPKNKQEELANKYLTQASEVFSVFDRLCRYEKYFTEFLPPKDCTISEAEAIEYHLRNYVQDFYILRERIHKFVRDLKNDLCHYSLANTTDVEKALDHLATNIDKNFKEINDKLRRTHVHERSISDYDLTRSKFMGSILSGEIPIPNGVTLNNDYIKDQYENITKASQQKYIEQATHNCVGLKKAKQFFAARFGYIFVSLNGHNLPGFDMNAGFENTEE